MWCLSISIGRLRSFNVGLWSCCLQTGKLNWRMHIFNDANYALIFFSFFFSASTCGSNKVEPVPFVEPILQLQMNFRRCKETRMAKREDRLMHCSLIHNIIEADYVHYCV